MTLTTAELFDAAKRLHTHLLDKHWTGQALKGPDSGIRFNFRIGRFIKSYLSFVPWSDHYSYMQGQAYWIFANWLLADLTREPGWNKVALDCTEYVLDEQQAEGFWVYPNPEWRGRILTVEGCFAALGLLESYCHGHHEPFLEGARRWEQYLTREVRFEGSDGLLAIHYFANSPGSLVPNNTTLLLWNLARLAEATGDDRFLATCQAMVAWLNKVQLESGELPYAVEGLKGKDRTHFLCYQYNAFEFLDLAHYYHITRDRAIWPVLEGLARYLATGLTEAGAARYTCYRAWPEVNYYTAAVGRALGEATALGVGDFRAQSDRAFKRLLAQQRPDGGFKFFSRNNYRVLADRRSYPRNLAMILYHLLSEAQARRRV